MPGILSNASYIELLWTGVALIGFGVSVKATIDAIGDLWYLVRSGRNGARAIVAWANLRAEVVRSFQQGVFVGVGIFAIATPERPDGLHEYPTTVAAGFIVMAVVLVLHSLSDQRDRRRLLAELGGRRSADHTHGDGP